MFQGFLFNALELNHAFLSQECTRQRRGQMEPSSLPTTPGQGPAPVRCPGVCVRCWQPSRQPWGVLPARPLGSCQLSLTHRQQRQQKQTLPLLYTTMCQGTSTLPATLNTFKGHSPSPFEALTSFPTAGSRYLARYLEILLPPSTNTEP